MRRQQYASLVLRLFVTHSAGTSAGLFSVVGYTVSRCVVIKPPLCKRTVFILIIPTGVVICLPILIMALCGLPTFCSRAAELRTVGSQCGSDRIALLIRLHDTYRSIMIIGLAIYTRIRARRKCLGVVDYTSRNLRARKKLDELTEAVSKILGLENVALA